MTKTIEVLQQVKGVLMAVEDQRPECLSSEELEAAMESIDKLLQPKAPGDIPFFYLQLAQQVMSDCGVSINNERLLERIASRLHREI